MPTSTEPSQDQVFQFVISAHGDLPRLKELLQANPELLNARYVKFHETALEAASHMGRREIAEYLLQAGAPLNICTASMLGMTGQVEEFLKANPSDAHATGAHGIPVLFHAALSGKTEIAEMLVAHGGGEGTDGSLAGAVASGHLEMARWLLDRGADPNSPNFEGKTPLHVANERGYTELADLLRERGGTE